MLQRIWWLFLALAITWISPAFATELDPDCSNPRAATDSLFQFLQANNHNPSKAKVCLDVPPDGNGERLAVQLKQVLDARGLYSLT